MSYCRESTGVKLVVREFNSKLAIGDGVKMGKTVSEIKSKSNVCARRMGMVACLLLLLTAFCAPAAQAQTRLIVRDSLGLPGINLTCLLTGCKVATGFGDPNGQLFVVTFPAVLKSRYQAAADQPSDGHPRCGSRPGRDCRTRRMPAPTQGI